MTQTAGTWNREDGPLYFIAANPQSLTFGRHVNRHMLTPVNDLSGEAAVRDLTAIMDAGVHVFLDSGVFALVMEHARAHGMTMNTARTLAPEEIDGFDELLSRYTDLARRFESRLWGYVELDMGGTAHKRRIRTALEAEGLRPVPVYHPLADPPEYLDELCEQYDRVCVGNMVGTDRPTRLRIVATIAERRARHPDTWFHLLGFTPSEWCFAYEFDSCDSSTWLAGTRWPAAHRARANLRAFSPLVPGMTYDLNSTQDEPRGHGAAKRAYAYDAHMNLLNWRALRGAMNREGIG